MGKRWVSNARRCAAVAGVAGMVATFAPAAAAHAATLDGSRAKSGESLIPQGINPAKDPAATQAGTTNPSTPVTVAFIMKARNLTQLESKVSAGWSGPYMTVSQFASAYGQPPAIIGDLATYLGKFGITTSPYPDGLDVTAHGTAGEFNRALGIGFANYKVPSAGGSATQTVYASKADPQLPSSLASHILSILGLTNYAPFVSNALRANGLQPATVAPNTAAPNAAAARTIPPGERTPSYFIHHYHLGSVESAGALGQGQTVGIVTLASVNPIVPQTFWKKYLHLSVPAVSRIHLVNIDGGAGPVSLNAGSDETTLDVEQSGAIATQANIDVYQAPNTDNGFVDGFFAAASANVAGSVSSSWGESETAIQVSVLNGTESATYAASFNEAYLELAAQGQSSFVSSADTGAYTASRDIGTKNLSADNPADSPYITAAGGTTVRSKQTYPVLNKKAKVVGTESVSIPKELSWSSDYLWPLYKALGYKNRAMAARKLALGSGGGYSIFDPRPSYQMGVSGVSTYSYRQFLRPIDYTDANGILLPTKWAYTVAPKLGTGTNTKGRAIPDVAFDADPFTGYALYDPQFKRPYGAPVQQFGGTSFVAPQLNGTTAVMESALGHRIGFWNPSIYAAAGTAASAFTPISSNQFFGKKYYSQTDRKGKVLPLDGLYSNNNLYYAGTPGTAWNPASGLGYANLAKLTSFFATHP